ncbi:integral membrane protein [Microbacterium marinum]|uniref:Integral membrane protein n=1 Tax=Microbacterium marinum TaxID=421115 RepID=A0A7W7BPZ7_9MICO|nr:integral membrane protein [Microbacterium marinum]
MFRTPATLFRVLAIAEACSWTLLLAGLLIRALGGPSLAVTIGGGIHGFVFLSYGATAILVALNNRWGIGPAVVAVGSAIVPYATVPAEIWLRRSGRLAGAWRLEETDDPRDRRSIDRLLRWFLRHAVLLVALLVVAVVALYVVLLIVGPPGR